MTGCVWDAVTLQALPIHVGYSNFIALTFGQPEVKFTDNVSISGFWVTEAGSDILWLPPDYRATCQAVWKNTIVLGHSSGRVSIFEFEDRPNHVG